MTDKETGATLRDYFAAMATEEDINAHTWKGYKEPYSKTLPNGKVFVGERLALRPREEAKYHYADAMLEARKK